ncbi:hypothetical protein H5410_016447 [Solanum commersonii]|uniref:Uncharacterized protein n=1 Tax=Solanum commersonii TaxID=4109 RepID=A0A9J5ZXN8_SOLCO|nr:hypothetical protein H5410_016447 [Solanum commersonii]
MKDKHLHVQQTDTIAYEELQEKVITNGEVPTNDALDHQEIVNDMILDQDVESDSLVDLDVVNDDIAIGPLLLMITW